MGLFTVLEFARRDRKWSQTQLATVTRLRQNFISQIECGLAVPDGDQLERLAKALGVSADALLDPVPAIEDILNGIETKGLKWRTTRPSQPARGQRGAIKFSGVPSPTDLLTGVMVQ
jgi:transcriptional regulator with XRE-family HTH domain